MRRSSRGISSILASAGIHGTILTAALALSDWTPAMPWILGPTRIEMDPIAHEEAAPRPASPGVRHESAPLQKTWRPLLTQTAGAPKASWQAPPSPPGAAQGADAQATLTYLDSARSRIQQHLSYPITLRARGITGSVALHVTLKSDGSVAEASVTSSSGRAELDANALEAVRGAAPFPPFKEGTGATDRLSFSLPVDFRIKR